MKPNESGNKPMALSQMNGNELMSTPVGSNELISTPIGSNESISTAHPSAAFGLANTHVCGGE
jgi:hypothetical protein